ncbi:hypothetical protein THRCLA_11645 [Thraustotheca clavata]|uniref:F-box domain-containing protein n=1 Tax=Thraustotheca clavata TaxID=74557 RepID=A0A1V9Y728_9STRA|nr:hypothetical protein THRCLA_11645 [Thraustotheca clavata]
MERKSSEKSIEEGNSGEGKSAKKKRGFGFGNFIAPKFNLSTLNPLKLITKKASPVKKGAPPPPNRPIAKLFQIKYSAHLRLISSFLPFNTLGRLTQVSESMQDFVLEVFQTPQYMNSYKGSIPTKYFMYQTLLRDHLLSRNRTANDKDITTMILSYLTLKERLGMTLVCRRFIGIVSSMNLHICGQKQGYAFVHGYDIESKAYWPVRHRYGRSKSISLNYLTSAQVMVILSAIAHECFPKIQQLHINHVCFTESPMTLCGYMVDSLNKSNVWSKLETISLQGMNWTIPGYAMLFNSFFQNSLDQLLHLDLSGTYILNYSTKIPIGNPLDHITLVRLAPCFIREHFIRLETWSLRRTNLTSTSFSVVLECLPHLPSLRSWDISENDIAIDGWEALTVYAKQSTLSVFNKLTNFNCSGCAYNVSGMAVLFSALSEIECPCLEKLEISALAKCFVNERFPLILLGAQITAESLPLLAGAFAGHLYHFKSKQNYNLMPGHTLQYLNLSGTIKDLRNNVARGALALWEAMETYALKNITTLIVSNAGLSMQEFNMLATTFEKVDCCPQLFHLDLGGITSEIINTEIILLLGNVPKSLGIIRFTTFFKSMAATRIRFLDLSYAIESCCCDELLQLNISRNLPLQSTTLAHVNQMVRGTSCPTLRCLQIHGRNKQLRFSLNYSCTDSVTVDAGYDLVKQIKTHSSPATLALILIFESHREDLRANKREAFIKASHEEAIRTDERTKVKCAIRRNLYDRLEQEAAQANRARNSSKKKTKHVKDLPIFRKIEAEILAAS